MHKEYLTTPFTRKVLVEGKILGPNETPQEMFERVVNTLFEVEGQFNTDPEETQAYKNTFIELMAEKAVAPGTPTLTNAGRHTESAISSCVVIPVDLREKQASEKIKAYYRQNMGSGFDFTPYENPVELLLWLNDLAATESATGNYDRYIGNMGNISVYHPRVREFIRTKREKALRHFNISVDVDDEFMDKAINERGKENELLWEIAESAHFNGDPGIINLGRMNRGNPVSKVSSYTSTPPCSEMGLAAGETCQFGYINLVKFVTEGQVDYEKLATAVEVLTRTLDNGIQLSINNYPDPQSAYLARLNRKIGIGVCGLADTFLEYGLPYDSDEARQLARNMLSFINYTSKQASVELAKQRGSCLAMGQDNGYYNGFLDKMPGTDTVSQKDWQELAEQIKTTKLLRNILTTALPPTGRSSILMGSNSSIEPIFGVTTADGNIRTSVKRFVERHANGNHDQIIRQAREANSFQETDLLDRECLLTATEISPEGHLKMLGALVGEEGVYDETASKTINLPQAATVRDVYDIFVTAHQLGLKNIAVYRDGSYKNQPNKL